MLKKYIELIKERETHIKDWLKGKEEERQLINTAGEIIEQCEWEIDFLKKMDFNLEPNSLYLPVEELQEQNDYLFSRFPINRLSPNDIAGIGSISSASSTDIVVNLQQNGIDLTPFSNEIDQLSEMQIKHDKFGKTLARFQTINPSLANELNTSKEAYESAKHNLSDYSYAGISMRNVIEHLKGELCNNVPKYHKGKKKWIDLVKANSIGKVNSIEFNTLLGLEKKFKQLHTDLTYMSKNLKLTPNYSFNTIWVVYIDFLFTLTGLIKL